jgi:protein CpxP
MVLRIKGRDLQAAALTFPFYSPIPWSAIMHSTTLSLVNKRIQTLALSVLLLSGLSLSAAFAEDGSGVGQAANGATKAWGHGHGGHRGGGRCGIFKQLNLTDAQKAQLKAQRETFKQENAGTIADMKAKREQLRQLGKDTSNSAQRQELIEALHADRKILMEKHKASMQNVLTPAQISQLKALKAQCKANHAGKKHDGHQGYNHENTPESGANQ